MGAGYTRVFLDSHTTDVSGLLGNADGSASNDLRLPDGTVLTQPVSFEQLYSDFANAWRVTPSTSLFDYASGESTATYTNTSFPRAPVTVQDLPDQLVDQARQVVASYGITNAVDQQNAILDYILSGGNAAVLEGNRQTTAGDTSTAHAVPTAAPVAELLGIAGPVGTLTVDGSAGQTAQFTVFLNAALSSDVAVSYAVIDAGTPAQLGASDFGGTLPSGTVTVAAGATSATFTIALPSTLSLPLERLDVGIATAAPGITLLNTTSAATLKSGVPVEGADAVPQFIGGGNGIGTITGSGSNYTLDLGTIGANGIPSQLVGVLNAAAAYADALGGSFAIGSGSGFTISNIGSFTGVAPGQARTGIAIDPSTSLGAHSETLVLSPTQGNVSGYSGTLSPVTLTITDDVVSPTAQPAPVPAEVHLQGRAGTGFSGTVTVANRSPVGSDRLGVTLTDQGGRVLPVQTGPLGPGQSSTLALNNTASAPGAYVDTLDIGYRTINPNTGASTPLTGATVTVDDTVYQSAAESSSDATIDFGTVQPNTTATRSLSFANTAPAGAYSDDLVVALPALSGPVTSTSGSGITVQAGQSGAIDFTFSSAVAGTVNEDVTVNFYSHDAALSDVFVGSKTYHLTGTVAGSGPQTTSTYADGQLTEAKTTGITGQPYDTQDKHFGADGKPTSTTYGGVSGEPYDSYTSTYGSNGRTSKIVYNTPSGGVYATGIYAPNGSYSVDHPGVTGQPYTSVANNYAANNTLTSSTYSGYSGRPYTSQTTAYAPSSEVTWTSTFHRADGSVYAVLSRTPGGGFASLHPGIIGQPYTAYENFYAPDNTLLGASYTGYTGAYDTRDTTFGANGRSAFLAFLKNGVVTATQSFNPDGSMMSTTSYGLPPGQAVTNQGTFSKAGTTDTWSVARPFVNTGTVNVESGAVEFTQGASNASSVFDVGAHAKIKVTGDLTGAGTVDIHGSGSTFELGGRSSNTFAFTDTSAATLLLDAPASFDGHVQGFGSHSVLDLQGFSGSSALSYAQGQGGGTLTVTDGSHHAVLAFVGSYAQADFAPPSVDLSGTGLLVKHA